MTTPLDPAADGDGDDLAAALEAIKTAHAEPLRLSREEVLEFLRQPINLGRPTPPVKAAGVRGPKSKKTPYDLAYERRRDLYRKLKKLPDLGRDAGWMKRPEYVAVLRAVLADDRFADRRQVREVLKRLARLGKPAPSERTVRRHLIAARETGPTK